MNIFIVSIDDGGGKTVISAGIAAVMQSLGYKTGVYKPIQTGAIDKEKFLVSPDLTFVKMLDPYITTHSTYMFKGKTVPSICAKEENNEIDLQNIIKDYTILSQKTDILVVESTGGLMTPINDNMFTYHIPQTLKIPVVFVVTPSTNSISHYFNEVNTAKAAGIDVAGVIINKFPLSSQNPEIKTFPSMIEGYCDIRIIGLIPKFRGNSIKTNILINEILNGIDLADVFKMKIPKLSLD